MQTTNATNVSGRRTLQAVLAAAVFLLALSISSCGGKKTEPVLPKVSRAAFSTTWSERQVFLVGLGDSITAGYGASSGRSYFELLTTNAPEEAPDMEGISLSAVLPKLEAFNFSMSASTSAEHLAYQLPKLPAFDKDILGIAVITTGGNDIIHNYGAAPPRDGAMYGATLAQAQPWIRSFEERLWKIIDRVEERFPGGCHVFLANIYDPTDGTGDIENAPIQLPAWSDGKSVLHRMNEVLARCAKLRENVHLVDIREPFLGHGIHHRDRRHAHYDADDPSYWYFENLEDPNDVGYDCIRRLFLSRMAEVLGPSQSAARESSVTSKGAKTP